MIGAPLCKFKFAAFIDYRILRLKQVKSKISYGQNCEKSWV